MKKITLSFDNGPDPQVTPYVLDILRRKEVLASFFVLGDKLRDRRHLCERAHEEGHIIGNHTFNHLVPLGQSRSAGAAVREIRETERLLDGLRHPDRFFRPFGGGGILDERLLNQEALDCVIEDRHTVVLWNAVPRDWEDPEGWPDVAMQQCRDQEHALLVLHDLPTGAMSSLESFIDSATAEGFHFVQEFPTDCLPIRNGKIFRPMDAFVSLTALN